MLTLGGRRTIVDVTDGTSLLATTRFTCWPGWLRLREVTVMRGTTEEGRSPAISVNAAHIIALQFPQ